MRMDQGAPCCVFCFFPEISHQLRVDFKKNACLCGMQGNDGDFFTAMLNS